jgi:Ni,Fe-hydrogenase III small subunit/ferredoxin
MLEWLIRGIGRRRVTTRYPHAAEVGPAGFRGSLEVRDPRDADPALADVCPTGAIRIEDGEVRLDRGRCILCGACVAAEPGRFAFAPAYETAARRREALIVGATAAEVPAEEARAALGDQIRQLRRSVHIRHVDAGSDGTEEWEIQALTNPYYDIHRLGLFFTASPRHADLLLVTGGVTAAMREPLELAWAAMPEPKAVVAAGTDACSGGLAEGLGTIAGGVDRVLPVDVYIPGSPPSPIALLHGLLLAVGVLREEPTP